MESFVDVVNPKDLTTKEFVGAKCDALAVEATPTAKGMMSAADKTKLNGIASGAEVNVNADWNASAAGRRVSSMRRTYGAGVISVASKASTALGPVRQVL